MPATDGRTAPHPAAPPAGTTSRNPPRTPRATNRRGPEASPTYRQPSVTQVLRLDTSLATDVVDGDGMVYGKVGLVTRGPGQVSTPTWQQRRQQKVERSSDDSSSSGRVTHPSRRPGQAERFASKGYSLSRVECS